MSDITSSTIIAKLESSELYFAELINSSLVSSRLGLVSNTINRENNIYYLIRALRFRVDKNIYDDTTTNLFKNLEREIPIFLEIPIIDPYYIDIPMSKPREDGIILPDLSDYVRKHFDETINGIKTFIESPIVPTATENDQAVNLGQILSLDNFIINSTTLQASSNFHIDGSGVFEANSIGINPSNRINLINTTLATSSIPTQVSPSLQFTGNAWNSSSSASNNFGYRIYMLPVTAGSPFPSLSLDYGIGNTYLNAATFTKGNLLIGGVVSGFAILNGTIDATSGLAHAYYENADIGATANNDVLVGLDLNDTFSRGNAIATASTITPGSGYTPGTYTNVALPSNHSNTAAHATIIVDGAGHVTSVTFPSGQGGARYTIGQSITISNSQIGGTGSGFSFLVGTLSQYTGLSNYALRARNAASIFAPSTSTYGSIIIPTGLTYTGASDGSLWNDGTNLWGYIGGVATQITNQTPSLTGFVPYTGATTNVDLDSHFLTASALIAGDISSGIYSGMQSTQVIIADTDYTTHVESQTYTISDSSNNVLHLLTYDLSTDKIIVQGKTVRLQTTIESTSNDGQPNTLVRNTDLSTYAIDSTVVHKTGVETVAGDKTFTGTTAFNANVNFSGANLFMGNGVIGDIGSLEINDTYLDPAKTYGIQNFNGVLSFTRGTQAGVTIDLTNNRLYTSGTNGSGAGVAYALISDIPVAGTYINNQVVSPQTAGFSITGNLLSSTGKLGLGTASPSTIIHAEGNEPTITLKQTHATTQSWQLISGTSIGTRDFELYNSTDSKTGFHISNDGEFRIGSRTNIVGNSSRLYIFGGSAGANVDAKGDSSLVNGDQATFEAESADYATTTKSIAIRYYGSTLSSPSTVLGLTGLDMGILDFGLSGTSVIRNTTTSPILLGINNTEVGRLTTTGLSINSVSVVGTGGNGYINLIAQTSPPTTPTVSHQNIYADASGRFTIMGSNGFAAALTKVLLTGSQVYSLPDATGVLMLNPMTSLGDLIYGDTTGIPSRLAGNATTTRKFLTQTGTGSGSNIPVWFDLFGGANTYSGNNTFSATQTFTSQIAIKNSALLLYNGATAFYMNILPDSGLSINQTVTLPSTGSFTIAYQATTLAGYGITDAYTKTISDANYVAITGSTSTGLQQIQLVTQQLSLNYDGTNKTAFTTNSTGQLTIAPTGTLVNITGSMSISANLTAGTNTSSFYVPSGTTAVSQSVAQYQYAGSSNNYIKTGIYGGTSTSIATTRNYSTFIVGASPITLASGVTIPWATSIVANTLGIVTNGGGGATITNTASLYVEAPSSAGVTNHAAYINGRTTINGDLYLLTAGNALRITEGTNGRVGQTTLVAGTKAITISGLTTSSRAFITLVTPGGASLTIQYQGVCTSNTLTIQANIAAGTINTSDVSVLNYFIIN